eukprot:6735760-Lingulodinium_polyedra.AAC.1
MKRMTSEMHMTSRAATIQVAGGLPEAAGGSAGSALLGCLWPRVLPQLATNSSRTMLFLIRHATSRL